MVDLRRPEFIGFPLCIPFRLCLVEGPAAALFPIDFDIVLDPKGINATGRSLAFLRSLISDDFRYQRPLHLRAEAATWPGRIPETEDQCCRTKLEYHGCVRRLRRIQPFTGTNRSEWLALIERVDRKST